MRLRGDLESVQRLLRIGLERAEGRAEAVRKELARQGHGTSAAWKPKIDRLTGELEAQATTIVALKADMEALSKRLGALPNSNDLKTVSDALTTLTAHTEEIASRLEAQERKQVTAADATVGATGSEGPAPPESIMSSHAAAVPVDPRPGTEPAIGDLYQAAYLDFSRGNYALAIGGFREFVRRHPENEAADNAQYWIGEAYFSLAHRYADRDELERAMQARKEAVQAFHEVGKRHPYGDKVPAALYREALVLFELEQPDTAQARLEYLIDRFPRAPEARLAREHVTDPVER